MKLSLKRLFICTAVFFSLLSCNSDDDNSTNNSDSDLVGEWNLTAYNYDGITTTEIQGISTTSSYVGEAINIDATLDITENPNELTASGSYDVVLTTEVQGQTIEQTVPVNDILTVSTWTRSGDILFIEGEFVSSQFPGGDPFNGEPVEYIIEELTSTTLRLTTNVELNFEQSGAQITTALNVDMILNK